MIQKTLETSRIHLIVNGKVQGVGFRVYVQHTAKKMGLTGWVRNIGYSQVESVAEGNPEVLKGFAEAVKLGPRSARVDDMSLTWEDPIGDLERFEIIF